MGALEKHLSILQGVCNENVATLTVAFRERAARSVKKVEKEKY
jgi:hypothetical protein